MIELTEAGSELKPKTTLSLSIDDLETGDGSKTRLEFYEDSPDTIQKTVEKAVNRMIKNMGYLERSK